MKIYLAHNFVARLHLPQEVMKLEAIGHKITSTWITNAFHALIAPEMAALEDLMDIERADALLLYTDQFGPTPGRGKFIELGYALGKNKQCYIIGNDDNNCVFFSLAQVTRIRNYSELPL